VNRRLISGLKHSITGQVLLNGRLNDRVGRTVLKRRRGIKFLESFDGSGTGWKRFRWNRMGGIMEMEDV